MREKTYLPILENTHMVLQMVKKWSCQKDFYSSRFYVDKMIEFIESNRGDGKTVFSPTFPFQAVHIPVQVPQEYTNKYMGNL